MSLTRRSLISVAVLAVTSARASRAEQLRPTGAWSAKEIGGVAAAPGVTSTLDIAADGNVTGSGGCNRYRGRVEIGQGTILFSPLAATRMACAEAAMRQEQGLFTALAGARRFRIEGGSMLLIAADGTVLARFQRSA